MARDLPGSVVNSLRVLALLVAVAGLTTLVTWFQRDEVLLAWAKGNPSAQEILAQGGVEALRGNQIAPGFVALSVVAFVGLALLAVVLAAFLVGGFAWARLALTATAFTGALVAAVVLANDMPAVFVALSLALLVLGALLVFFLWRRDTTAYLRGV